jgi:light-regulated signal transduction histidine kinase (bacteriophytochrome)
MNMSPPAVDVTLCDREPIHNPGSIQPHGVLLVAERAMLTLRHAAGPVAAWLGEARIWTNGHRAAENVVIGLD